MLHLLDVKSFSHVTLAGCETALVFLQVLLIFLRSKMLWEGLLLHKRGEKLEADLLPAAILTAGHLNDVLLYYEHFVYFNFFLTHRTPWDNRKFFPSHCSATGGRQALRHSWTCRTLLCGANARNSTAGLLIVKWIQLLLVFS